MFKSVLSIGLLSLLPLTSQALIPLTLDDGKTPAQRYQAGAEISGIFSIHDPLHCSQLALSTMEQSLVDEDEVLVYNTAQTPVFAKEMIVTISQIARKALAPFQLSQDPALGRRSLCTGYYRDQQSQSGNALSSSHGYLVFDQRLIEKLYALPDSERSLWTLDFLVLHELAHQFQYWNNDSETRKSFEGLQTSRVPELAADCMAGAMLKQSHPRLNHELFNESFKGAMASAILLGDYQVNHQGHHGTPIERGQALVAGSNWMSQRLQGQMLMPKTTTLEMLNYCNEVSKQN